VCYAHRLHRCAGWHGQTCLTVLASIHSSRTRRHAQNDFERATQYVTRRQALRPCCHPPPYVAHLSPLHCKGATSCFLSKHFQRRGRKSSKQQELYFAQRRRDAEFKMGFYPAFLCASGAAEMRWRFCVISQTPSRSTDCVYRFVGFQQSLWDSQTQGMALGDPSCFRVANTAWTPVFPCCLEARKASNAPGSCVFARSPLAVAGRLPREVPWQARGTMSVECAAVCRPHPAPLRELVLVAAEGRSKKAGVQESRGVTGFPPSRE
jgi:hypothetical protein